MWNRNDACRSDVERGHGREARRQRGAFEVEFIIVAMLMLVLAGAVGSMVVSARRAQTFVDRSGRLTTTTQDIMELMRAEVGSSTHLFNWDTWGYTYMLNIDTSAAPFLATRRLPWIHTAGVFNNDYVTGYYKTGGMLLFSIHDRTDTFEVAAGEYVRTNIYRIVAWYLTKIPGKDHTVDNDAFDIVHWVSEPLVDWDQVSKVTDPAKQKALLVHLYDGTNPVEPAFPYPPARVLWRHGHDDYLTAFQLVNPDGTTAAQPDPYLVPMDEVRSQTGLLSYRHMAVASNLAGSARGIARFGFLYTSSDGFPHGMEFQVIGPASARQVLIHLTLCTQRDGSEQAFMDLQGIVDTRDL